MIWSAIIFYTVLIIDLWTDMRRYLRREKINHVRGFFLRIVGLISSIIFLPHDYVLGAAVEGLLYMTLFNGLFNIMIGQSWFYIGSSSWIDKQMSKLGIAGFLLQYGLLIIFILIYFL